LDPSRSSHTSNVFIKKLTSSIDAPPSALAGGLLGETVATAALFSKSMAHVVDYFLGDDMVAAQTFFGSNSSEADAKIIPQIRQALREIVGSYNAYV
jgi:hypothetical protein